jgi:hypothetical protein
LVIPLFSAMAAAICDLERAFAISVSRWFFVLVSVR